MSQPSLRAPWRRVAALMLLSSATIGMSACGNNETPPPAAQSCFFDADCVTQRERCNLETRLCERLDVPECAKDEDCRGGDRCRLTEGVCYDPSAPADMGADMSTPQDMGQDMTPTDMGPVDMGQIDMPPSDTTPPRVTRVQPAPEDGPIPTDQTFLVSFSEAIQEVTIAPTTLYLLDPAERTLTTEATYDALTTSALVTPSEPLRQAEAYELVIDRRIRDTGANELGGSTGGEDVVLRYYTKVNEEEALRALAKKWAPRIYQGVFAPDHAVNWRVDLPTTVNFDGDFAATNNATNLTVASLDVRAHVYYHITESATHYFILYAMYYPAREEQNTDSGQRERYEHDMTGVMLVVDKASDSLVIVEGLRVEEFTDTRIPYTSSASPIRFADDRIRRSFNPNTLIDGTHYPLYIPAGRHEACNWQDGQPRRPLDLCLHPDSGFPNGDMAGVVLTEGEVAQTWSEATVADGKRQMTYRLIPFLETFWARRGEFGVNGMFKRGAVYRPIDNRPTGYVDGESHILPNELYSAAAKSFGKPPFNWLEPSNGSNAGQWLLDPAYELRQYYSVPSSVAWSTEYCNNWFFAIDRRGATPDCQ